MSEIPLQYLATTEAIQEYSNSGVRGEDLVLDGNVVIALSNLAVAEAVHLLTAAIKVRPVEITTTGSLTLDPEKVAAALQASIDKLRGPE